MARPPQLPPPLLLLLLLLLPLLHASAAAPTSVRPYCTARSFPQNRRFALCNDLPVLNSSLHWTHDVAASTLRIAFSAPPGTPRGWVSWGINPHAPTMLGTQALLAFRGDGGDMDVATYNVSSYVLRRSAIAYEVSELEAEYEENEGRTTIFATMRLPPGTSKLNQVWNVGPSVEDGVPRAHGFGAANMAARGTLDLAAGKISPAGVDSGQRLRIIHGILSAVSWGLLIPLGVFLARYPRLFCRSTNSAWFYAHVSCQLAGYIVGLAGLGTGFYLGIQSKGIRYTNHLSIAAVVLVLATLQVLALFLRPAKENRYRVFWDLYHRTCGYVAVVLGVVNVFVGLSILGAGKLTSIYFVAVVVMLGLTLLLEAARFLLYLKRNRRTDGDGDIVGRGSEV